MDSHLIYHANQMAHGMGGYSLFQIIMLTAGMVIWAFLYIYLAVRGLKTKFIQMPLVLACGNLVWEFLWGFIFQSKYEFWVMFGVGSAFLTDLAIFYAIWRYGALHQKVPFYAKNLRILSIFGILVWLMIWVAFKMQGMDTDGGGTSGNILNAVIAVFWVNQLFHIKDLNLMSVRLGWFKLLADIPVALFMMSEFPDKPFAYIITWISVLFDIIYIWVYYRRKSGKLVLNYLNN
jgi:hypothetical protein